ncbi:thiol-disulfide oxidoreductase DCC family protein [Rubrivirga sp. IMCC43871]|uniref:thiol-disulfide oxidoreductase DCC family protein n=1 Tax=Rubrivirga sp. IMCC43871 TaxID=3391575 RepID=UPI00398F9101
MADDGPILLFDGVCNVCDRSVQFVLDHDRRGLVRFASLQSEVGRQLLAECGVDASTDSVVLVANGRCHVRSDAALATARLLDAPWRWLAVARVVPRGLRDAVYDWVARNRYRWFGTRDACRIPTPEVRARFLDADEVAPAGAAS